MGLRTPPTGDANKAKEFATADIVKIDSDELRQLAQTLQDKAVNLTAIHARLDEKRDSAKSEVEPFKSEWEPDGQYDSVYESWETASHQYHQVLKTAVDRFQTMASGLQWIADNHDKAEQMAAERTSQIDTSLETGSSGNGSSSIPKQPSAPLPEIVGQYI